MKTFRLPSILAVAALSIAASGCAGSRKFHVASSPAADAAAATLRGPSMPLSQVKIGGEPLLSPAGTAVASWHERPGDEPLRIPPGKLRIEGIFRYTCEVRQRAIFGTALANERPYWYRPQQERLAATFVAEPGHEYRVEVIDGFRPLRVAGDRSLTTAEYDIQRRGPRPATTFDRYKPPPMFDGYVNVSPNCPELLMLRVTDLTTKKILSEGNEAAPREPAKQPGADEPDADE